MTQHADALTGDQFPYEILGYFEEIQEQDGSMVGTRPIVMHAIADIPRLGHAGRFTRLYKKGDIIQIDKAHKGMQPYTFKHDTECWITTQAKCGRMLSQK